MSLKEEINQLTRYQKIILSIYFVLSIPLLPFMAVMIPFAWWVTAPEGGPTRKLTLIEFLSFSVAMSLFAYLIAACLHWCPPQ